MPAQRSPRTAHQQAQRPHMRKAPRPNGRTPHGSAARQARPAARRSAPRAGFAPAAALLGVVALMGLGLALALGGAFDGTPAHQDRKGPTATVHDGDVVTEDHSIAIGLNGDEDTYVLKGEKYLEAGAHAIDAADGPISGRIDVSGKVDTSKAGDYEVLYRVSNSAGGTAQAKRTVHVVDSMDTMQGAVPILMYHYIYDPAAPPADLNGNYLASTSFDEQLAYLEENGFYFPSYPELKAFIEGSHSLPAKSVVLTFDDGEAGFLNLGVPLLEKHRIPATSFVIASDADAAQKVAEHRSPYVAFESHSFNMHRPGGSVGHGGIISAMSRQEIVDDLKRSQQIVGGTQALAYPFGDVTPDARQAVREAGMLCAFTTENRWARQGDDVTSLPRVRISGEYALDSFIALVNG